MLRGMYKARNSSFCNILNRSLFRSSYCPRHFVFNHLSFMFLCQSKGSHSYQISGSVICTEQCISCFEFTSSFLAVIEAMRVMNKAAC